MKKFIYLLPLSFMLFSFNSSVETKTDLDFGVCCTATITYNGEFHSYQSYCYDGNSADFACSVARHQAEMFIAAQQ